MHFCPRQTAIYQRTEESVHFHQRQWKWWGILNRPVGIRAKEVLAAHLQHNGLHQESIQCHLAHRLLILCSMFWGWVFFFCRNHHWPIDSKNKNETHEEYRIAAATIYFPAQHDIFILLISQLSKNLTTLTLMEMERVTLKFNVKLNQSLAVSSLWYVMCSLV